jgi:hypothetical protein
VEAAQRLAPIDVSLARATYMDALIAAFLAGRLASPGGSLLGVALAAGTAPAPLHSPCAPVLLLDGLSGHEWHELGGHGDEGAHHVAVFVFEDVAVVHVAAGIGGEADGDLGHDVVEFVVRVAVERDGGGEGEVFDAVVGIS